MRAMLAVGRADGIHVDDERSALLVQLPSWGKKRITLRNSNALGSSLLNKWGP
jgi:hypothetical protein